MPILLIPGGYQRDRSFISPYFSAADNYRNVTKSLAQITASTAFRS